MSDELICLVTRTETGFSVQVPEGLTAEDLEGIAASVLHLAFADGCRFEGILALISVLEPGETSLVPEPMVLA